MSSLDGLVREAAALAHAPAPAIAEPEREVARQLQICNACRYCEGFCAVFPAMARRLEFSGADVRYLANLCHHCGACLHACQYAPPHEFAVDVPRAMARARAGTWARHAWPGAFGRAYERNGLVVSLALAASLAGLLILVLARTGTLWGAAPRGDFYGILPHGAMVGLFAPVFAFAVVALAVGVARFWRESAPGRASGAAIGEATRDALRLRYLDGGHGDGCNEADDRFTLARRRWHHLAFYGFAACFAATCVGTLYHYAFGWVAPYGWSSVPKLLGTAGGIALCAGTAGLWRLQRTRPGEPALAPMDRGFVALLFVTSATGLALAVARGTAALPLLLALHLGCVLAFFATMPYGKFAHGVYRVAALLKWAIERRRPLDLKLGGE